MLSEKCEVEALFSRKTWNVNGMKKEESRKTRKFEGFEEEECPVGLLWAWVVAYTILIGGGNLEVAVTLVCILLTCWMSLVVFAAGGAVWTLFACMRYRKRLFKLQLKYGHFLLKPQTGEMSREDRKKKFLRNKEARKKERQKTLLRSKQSPGQHTPVLTPQIGGLSMTNLKDAFKNLASANSILLDDDVLDKIENLGALYAILRESVSTTQMCGALLLYFKTHYKKSIALSAANYLAEICELEFSAQTGEFLSANDRMESQYFDQQDGEFKSYLQNKDKPKWLNLLKECQENWSLVIRNEGFSKISRILSLSLALGLCEASSLDFRIGGMKMFSIGAIAKQASSVDLIDAVFETIVYFAEGGYACFERGSIKPLIYGNMENEEFEDNYGRCQQCFDYAKAGNLHLEGLDENDYEQLLCLTIEKCQTLVHAARGPVEKNVLRRKLDTLRLWQASFRQTRVQGGLRCAPYSVGVYGGTGVGKSSVANILMITTLLHNNYCATDDRIITLNESDKYMSNYRSFINGVLVDDIGNTKADFVEKAPTTLMIQLVNNVKMYANMAEAELKGKVSVEPKVVIGTKNVKDTCATVYSNEPASIARRDRITLTVTVRDEFRSDGMLDANKVRAHYGSTIPLIPDLWNITVERAFPVKSGTRGQADKIGWKVLNWEGRQMKDISIKQLVRFIAEDSKSFYVAQEQLVDNQNNLAEKFVKCKHCGLVTDVCECASFVLARRDDRCCYQGYCNECKAHHHQEEPIFDNQLGEKIALFIHQRIWKYSKQFQPKFDYWTCNLEEKAVDYMIDRLNWLETSSFTVWTNWVPTEWLALDTFKDFVWLTNKTKLKDRIRQSYLVHIFLIVCILLASIFGAELYIFLIPYPLMSMARIVEVEKERLYGEVAADNAAMPEIFRLYRDKHIKWITGLSVTIAAVYAVACIWKAFKVTPSPQGNLAPTGDQDIVERDQEVNPWASAFASAMPCTERSKTTSVETLETMVEKNLAHMELRPKGTTKVYECDAFFPCSNVALVPNHMWKTDDLKVKFTRHDPDKIGGNFETWLHKGHSYHIPGTDLSLAWVPNGGDWKDLTEYLPTGSFSSAPARLVYKKSNGSKLQVGGKTPQMLMHRAVVQTRIGNYAGHVYKLPFNTFEGLCMGTIVTETKGPTIGGFHLSGATGHVDGGSGSLTQSQLKDAIEKLSQKTGVVLAKSEGTIPTQLYDVQYFQGTDIHPKSAINFLPKGAYCKYYGQCLGRATYHSEVEDTVISKDVTEVTGVPQKWGPPKFRVGYPFQASLQYSTKPSQGIEGSLLIRAAKDFIRPLLRALDAMPKMKSEVQPLTEMETVCGIDGRRFIDKMPPSTSIGFPLSGPKSNYLTPLEPEDYPTHQCPAQLDPMFWKHAYEMEELYLQGKRAYPIFKACLKDEPTPKTKDKVRVFQGAPTALQLLVRKYYLPIARVLSVMPLTSECAVGVNAQGPEWDQLAKHIKSYGEDRILAGDYSKYDLRMPAQVMFTAFRIMIDIGKHCGYTDRDAKVMEGIATDICYPLMAYNGDLIQHYGSNPSGQNLTVYINSIVNALLFRCAYFEICKDRPNLPEFKDACALITYGDDAKSSVHTHFPEFNHIAVAKFLEERDMKFTMPDKESEPVPFMTDEEADLLKRKNIFCEDIGRIMGALDEDSIFKSLHAVLRSKAITQEQQAMQVIDGALREWFSYGREHYELRREQMTQIAERAGIAHGCTMIHVSYDDQLETYKEKYG